DGEHSGERCRCWSASRDPDPCWVTHRERGGRLAPAPTNLGRGTSRRGGGYTPSPEIRLSCRDRSRWGTRCPDRVLLRRERGPPYRRTPGGVAGRHGRPVGHRRGQDRKSTRLNSSHVSISYA